MFGEYNEYGPALNDGFEDDQVEMPSDRDIRRGNSDPSYDYFAISRPSQPKRAIGLYVAEQAFRVPLINSQSEWESAFDDGTAKLRSEMKQDYDGWSGLFSSHIVRDPSQTEERPGFTGELGKLVMLGLRSGELGGTEYMRYLRGFMGWADTHAHILEQAMLFGADIWLQQPTASRWRYIKGTNVSIFADPHVEGRYYLGATPPDSRSVGGFTFDAGEYDEPKMFRKHKQPIVARPFIEAYEHIRQLPLFDNTQNPVLELQQDLEGNIHFLQYYKTGQTRNFIEPFDLPVSEDSLVTSNVRGITTPEGKEMRLYMTPNKMPKGLAGNGLFCSIIRPLRMHVMFASKTAELVLHNAYISFQNNHFDTSPLFRPPLAAGLSSCQGTQEHVLKRLNEVTEFTSFKGGYQFDYEVVPYIDIKITSNGRQAVIESDWKVKETGYDDA
ncbi:MAG TPA: hypothetical protein VFN56_00850 [Candidatus Saccharimonadales bacterium]|nr:hypothetical protein [Candidatus Saccharimonadales bacterium]